jgi:hypothetical protein
MGNDQSQQGRQQIIRPPESDPYTLSSVAKASDSPVAISQVSAAPVKLHEKQPTGVDDIVQVVTMEPSEVHSPQSTREDEILDTIRNLPRVSPLIRGSVDSNFQWASFVSRKPNTGGATLDYIDSRPLIDICAEFQTYAMLESKSIASKQDELITRIRNVHVHTQTANQQLVKKSDGLKKVASALRDVERINRNVEASKQSVALIMKQLQELEELLPHHVKAQINTPLFVQTNLIAPPTMLKSIKS